MKSSPLTQFIGILILLAGAVWQTATAQEADTPASGTRPVKVVVVDDFGEVIAGVQIHRSVWTNAKFPPNADFTTDNNGEVTFDVPMQVDILRLWASKEGLVPMFANFDAKRMEGDPVPAKFTFNLRPGTVIGGFVRDRAGTPIAGAKVEVSVDSRDRGGIGEPVVNRWLAEGKDCRITDERGFWQLGNAPPGDEWHFSLRLRHRDHVDDLDWRSAREGATYTTAQLREQKAEVVMDSGVKVFGAITSPEGMPVPRALVIWGDDPYDNSNEQEVWADENGRYQLPPLSAGPSRITIIAEGFAPELRQVDLLGSKHEENFQLQVGETITLQIVDGTGKPVPQALVNITRWRGKTSLFNWRHSNVPYSKIPDKANDEGVYAWTWAPADAVEFSVSKKGFETVRGASYEPGTHTVTLHEKAR